MGLFDFFQKTKPSPPTAPLDYSKPRTVDERAAETMAQYEEREARRAADADLARSLDDLAPPVLDGKKISYHYKDVEIYGPKHRMDAKRGDKLTFVQAPQDYDPDYIAVYRKGKEIGYMKANRMRGMVVDWQRKEYPIFAAVSVVHEDRGLIAEVAFYGYVKKENQTIDS